MLAVAALVSAAAAAQSSSEELTPLQLDQSIQKLKEQALDLEQAAGALEQNFLYPANTRVSVYLGVRIAGMLIKELDVSIDGAAPVRYRYGQIESIVLQERGLHRLLSLNAQPGVHGIHAEFTSQYADAKAQDRPFTGHYDGTFTKGDGAAELELNLGRDAYLAPPTLKLREWSSSGANAYTAGSANDPRLRSAQFLAGNGQYLSAAALLLRIQNEAPQQRLAPEFYRELADDTLGFGMPQRAEAVYREQVAKARDPADLVQARLRLADFFYQRGYTDQASTELEALRGQVPKQLQVEWQDLMSRVLLAQGRYGGAVDILNSTEGGGEQTPYMRYNLGIALIRDGRSGQGVNVLDRIGTMTVIDDDTLALRDKTNLSLAYYFLRQGQGATAIPIFGRVREKGMYTNRALLGLGWAYLSPSGSKQGKAELGDERQANAFTSFATIGVLLRPGFIDPDALYRRQGLTSFKLDKGDKNARQQEAAFKRALVPWVELTSHDPMDPAVQEGMLAIPYALDGLGAHAQAQQYYERAIDALEQTRKRLDDAMEHVRSGRMVNTIVKRDADSETGWTWKLRDLPAAAETFYLQSLLAENSFQEALKNFRDVRLIGRSLDTWKKHLGDLEGTYTSRTREQDDAPPHDWRKPDLQGSARLNDEPDAEDEASHRLRLASHLASPTGDSASADTGSREPVPLKLAPSPQHFEGHYERMQAIAARIDALQPQLAAAEKAQRQVLEEVALADLQAQKKLNEKYLVESRFALARIYDRALKGEQP